MCVSINGPGDLDLLGTLGLRVLQLFAMYATDGMKKKLRLLSPFLRAGA